MAKLSAVGPGTEAGKLLLDDFKNWRKTGFKPWGKGVGSANHYKTRQVYQTVSLGAFRSQAKKIAKIALEQMPACDIQFNAENEDEKSLVIDSEKKNPWERELHPKLDDSSGKSNCDSEDDADFSGSSGEESVDSLDSFEDIESGELQSFTAALLSVYPCQGKLCAVFPLDGNVKDKDSNMFEFTDNNTAIRRWAKVPKERESAMDLIGLGTERSSKFGFTDIDLVVLDAELKRRLKENAPKRDENGDIWEIRETLSLPFRCHAKLFNKKGKELDTFRMRNNGLGFYWGYFWLLAWTPSKNKRSKRIGGKMVSVMSREDRSIYTEQTVRSSGPKEKKTASSCAN